jgi:hypothetical protein
MERNTNPVSSALKKAKKPTMLWIFSLLSIGKKPTSMVAAPVAIKHPAPSDTDRSVTSRVFKVIGTTRLNPPYRIVDALKIDLHGSADVAR